MGIISKTLKGFAGQVEAEPAPPPPAYTPLATNSNDRPSQQDSAHSMPLQGEYMYHNCAQPVQYQNQAPCPPQQGNAQYTPPTNYQTKYQNIAHRYQDKYENQYHSGKYQKYEDQYQNGQYQKYQDQYESGKYQKYQDQYQNGQYQRHQQKYQNYPYQQHIPQQSQYYPPPQPPLQAPPMQGPKPCVIPRKSTVPSIHTHVPQFSTNRHHPRTERKTILGGSYTSPFVRARVPELEHQTAISPPELLAFIDCLNEAFIPFGVLATADGSITRTKIYMRMANETVFRPKGLRAQINRTDTMLSKIGIANDEDDFVCQQYRQFMAESESEGGNSIAQCMGPLGDRVMLLSIEDVQLPVSAPNHGVNMDESISAQRSEHKQLRKVERNQAKVDRRRSRSDRRGEKIERKQDEVGDEIDDLRVDIENVMVRIQGLDLDQRGNEKIRKELKKDLKDLTKDLRDAEEKYEELLKKAEKKEQKDGKYERKQSERALNSNTMLWIVILPDVGGYAGDEDWDSDFRL